MREQSFASPQEALEHFGIKGMKWGVRKQDVSKSDEIAQLKEKPIVRTTKNGDVLTLSSRPPDTILRAIALVHPGSRRRIQNGAFLDISDKKGKKVGTASFWHEDKDTMHLAFIKIEKSERGKGYATEMLKAAAEYGKRTGKKKMTLEVPFDAPDARHIYEKLGFKVTKEAGDDVLTEMEYHFE